jgi:hypothetical protein
MDPHTGSKRWYWDEDIYYFPWLATSKKTEFLSTPLTTAEFNEAKNYPTSFANSFKDTIRPQHGIFPHGSTIGGRIYNKLTKGQVWALIFNDGKKGLLLIRQDQDQGWPDFASTGFRTRVDLIREK